MTATWKHGVVGLVAGLVCVCVLTASVVALGGQKVMPVDPERGLTDSQREALHSAGNVDFANKYAAWASQLNASSLTPANASRLNLSSMTHLDMDGSILPPPMSLSAAKHGADVIVRATVLSLSADPRPFGTNVSLSVSRWIKGSGGTQIVIRQASHFEPTPDWTRVVVVDAQWEPLLTPGQVYVLFLQKSMDGTLAIEPVTGTYAVQSGRLAPLSANPFGASVSGLTDAQAMTAIIDAN